MTPPPIGAPMPTSVSIATAAELAMALSDAAAATIIVTGLVAEVPTLHLAPGRSILGATPGAGLRFAAGQDGLRLSTDNRVEGLQLLADPRQRAVFNDTTVAGLGRLVLRNLRIAGCVRLLAQDQVRSGHVEVADMHVLEADARGFAERPEAYGVQVVPGAFTLWNRQADPAVTLTADLLGLSAGLAGAPVRGSGIFVGGTDHGGGRLLVSRLETGPVFSDGGIAPGTADRISGGVFTVSGAHVDSVHNRGPVTTYGPNDMVLDNWGEVDRWISDAKVTSYGPSAIGFVNFGTIGTLVMNAVIETFGAGARGFNVYDGTVRDATFERIVTWADGSVGLQISRPVGRIAVRRGITTHGGTGNSLVKGVVVRLPATPLSIKPGGTVQQLVVGGGLLSHGQGIDPLQMHGAVASLELSGGFSGLAGGFQPI